MNLSAGSQIITNSRGLSSSWRDYLELTKPRLSFLSVITALVGYLVTLQPKDGSVFIWLILGTSLAAGGAATLNQWLERDVDAKMVRTRGRPIPSEAITPGGALAFGIIISLAGCFILWQGTSWLAGLLALITQLSYVLLYTPLKKITRWNTEIGSVPGAIPPLIGWAAAENTLGLLAWLLFGIMVCWQIPHFMAIAWRYREDYARGGLRMLPLIDPTGVKTARNSMVFTILLALFSVAPTFFGLSSLYYGLFAAAVSFWFFRKALAFCRSENRDQSARSLFIASIIQLPILLGLLTLDRLIMF